MTCLYNVDSWHARFIPKFRACRVVAGSKLEYGFILYHISNVLPYGGPNDWRMSSTATRPPRRFLVSLAHLSLHAERPGQARNIRARYLRIWRPVTPSKKQR